MATTRIGQMVLHTTDLEQFARTEMRRLGVDLPIRRDDMAGAILIGPDATTSKTEAARLIQAAKESH